MKSFKRIISSLFIFGMLAALVMMTGCSQGDNLEDLSVIEGVGIDLDGDSVTATVQALNLIKEGSGAEALSGNVTMNAVGTGHTISAAIERVSKNTSKKLFFGQNRIIVFGMNMAENYLDKSLDYLLRSSHSRSDVTIAVARDKASEIMESPENDSLVPAQTISTLLSQSEKIGYGAHVTAKELLNVYADKTSDIYLPVLAQEGESVSVVGVAVYNDVKLAKILNEDETYGFLFLRGKVERGLLEISDNSLGRIGTEIISSKSKAKAEYENGRVIFKVDINVTAMLNEIEFGISDKVSDSEIKSIEKLAEKEIERLCKIAFDACMQNKSDAVRMGEYLAMYDPKAYEKLSDNWEQSLETAELQVNAKFRLGKINDNTEGN